MKELIELLSRFNAALGPVGDGKHWLFAGYVGLRVALRVKQRGAAPALWPAPALAPGALTPPRVPGTGESAPRVPEMPSEAGFSAPARGASARRASLACTWHALNGLSD